MAIFVILNGALRTRNFYKKALLNKWTNLLYNTSRRVVEIVEIIPSKYLKKLITIKIKTMALMKFFKTPKNQKFDYKPRYWDPKKEALAERMSKYKEENKGDTKAVKDRLRRGIKGKGTSLGFREARAIRTKELKRSNRVLLITVVVLALLSYLLFEIYLAEIVDMLE